MLIKNFVIFFENFYDKFFNLWDNLIKFFAHLGISKYEISKKRTGHSFLDLVNLLLYQFQNLYIFVARNTIYRKRPLCAKEAWVRSNLEKRFANFLTNHKIYFRYEKKLILFRQENNIPNIFLLRLIITVFLSRYRNYIIAHPDFYLPKSGIYVEVCGMMHDKSYFSLMKDKEALYKKNGISVIYLYPEDINNHKRLNDVFFAKLNQIKDKKEVPETKEY